jgi:hypothetical protein
MNIVRTYECTSQILKKLSQMVQNYSELYLTVPPGSHHLHCKLTPRPPRGWTGDSDLQLCHLPVDLRA